MKKLTSSLLALLTVLAAMTFPVAADNADPSADYTHIDAPYEDSGISLWFDYSTEKIKNTDTESTGMECFSVYMAKNEIEDAQWALYSEEGRSGLTAELSPMVNADGDALKAELFIQLYQDCDDFGEVPDAIPPLSAYGAFDLVAEKSQAFLVKVTTTADSKEGWYEATLTVKNSAGQAIKTAKVFTYVWNFALSEETACATSINLDFSYIKSRCDTSTLTANELYVNYYDYLLENRVSAYYLPYQLYNKNAFPYMDNPRVTSFQMGSFTGQAYSDRQLQTVYKNAFADNPQRFDKAYFFSNITDAETPAKLEELKAYYDNLYTRMSANQPDYADKPFWFINTYIADIDYQTADGRYIDQIEYYKDFVNLWCSKTFAYTSLDELSTPGAKLLQPQKWNSVYGTFKDRMDKKRADGQKVWWFISWDVDAPYINYFIQTDGVAQRILFWQQYDNDVQGFLYNFANFWINSDPYTANITDSSKPNAHGESVLVYPGSAYGLDTPVGSLRLEAMRDGIEDYQMFHMLEELKGDGACDKYIDVMTTGMVTYSVSDKDYYETRKALGKACENAVNGVVEPDEPVEEVNYGDLNNDGKLTSKDLNILCSIVSGLEEEVPAADVETDGKINSADVSRLTIIVSGN